MLNKSAPVNPAPDEADWRCIHETVLMLNLAVAQISNAMYEGDESVNTLTGSFATMMESIQLIHEQANHLAPGEERTAIDAACGKVGGQIQKTIIAFQFYDKLSQRLNHLSHSLGQFAQLLEAHHPAIEPSAWQHLQDDIKARFPIDSDKAVFEAILNGATAAEVMEYIRLEPFGDDEDVELF